MKKVVKVAVSPRAMQREALKSQVAKSKPALSQRDQYAKAMNSAQKNGGSNGIGIGN